MKPFWLTKNYIKLWFEAASYKWMYLNYVYSVWTVSNFNWHNMLGFVLSAWSQNRFQIHRNNKLETVTEILNLYFTYRGRLISLSYNLFPKTIRITILNITNFTYYHILLDFYSSYGMILKSRFILQKYNTNYLGVVLYFANSPREQVVLTLNIFGTCPNTNVMTICS